MNRGRVLVWTPDASRPTGARASLEVVPLLRLDQAGEEGARLWGRYVRVRNGGAYHVGDSATGKPRPTPIGDARPNAEGDFLFDPERGGARIDKAVFPNPDALRQYVEASHFGEVNAYYHLDRIAHYIDELLGELGAPSLPPIMTVVCAHHSATDREDGTRDGMYHEGRWRAFQGGHYRFSSMVPPGKAPEHYPVSHAGEIHLGPGRRLLRYGPLTELAGGLPYRKNASHIASILVHEYGHHVTAHTADYMANAARPPHDQRNRKTAMDEGTSDYWTAVILGSPLVWAWHRAKGDNWNDERCLTLPKIS